MAIDVRVIYTPFWNVMLNDRLILVLSVQLVLTPCCNQPGNINNLPSTGIWSHAVPRWVKYSEVLKWGLGVSKNILPSLLLVL